MISVTKDILKVLKANRVMVAEILITYEKDKGVYEGHFSDKDYDLNEIDLEDRISKIK